MGNDQSHLKNLNFSDKPAEKINECFLYDGEIQHKKITIIQEILESKIQDSTYFNGTALERSIKNLVKIRHPKVLKYITSFKKGTTNLLAVERCSSLHLKLQKQSDYEICLGLKTILCSLIFLVEQANVRHLNVAIQSIYVTEDGSWKMFGFEHLFKTNDLTVDLLTKSLSHRYKDAIDPNEIKNQGLGIEQYSFAVLCENIFKLRPESKVPHFSEFVNYCRAHLKHLNPSLRPLLSAVLLHPYFNQEFIKIHTFLSEIPLKAASAKQDFFTNLTDKLRSFDENVIGQQLGELLLSRIVLIDETFQTYVLPVLLKPQSEHSEEPEGIFSQKAFSKYLIPKLKQIFCVRDVQIRILLLEHFHLYVLMFTKEDLTEHILPQILLGVKDTNDLLVTKTLICLADLIPILGATVVIGENRKRVFADGRPQNVEDLQLSNWTQPRSITPVITNIDVLSGSPPMDNVDISESEENGVKNGDPSLEMTHLFDFDDAKEQSDNTDQELEVDEWSDWEENELEIVSSLNQDIIPEDPVIQKKFDLTTLQKSIKPPVNDNIDELDIKNQKFSKIEEKARSELDNLFKDMEPVIQKTNRLVIEETESSSANVVDDKLNGSNNNSVKLLKANHSNDKPADEKVPEPVSIDNTRFEMKIDEGIDQEEGGWGDSNEDWE